jgi:hypothetical protein
MPMLRKFLLACMVAVALGAAVGFAMPADATRGGATTLQSSP